MPIARTARMVMLVLLLSMFSLGACSSGNNGAQAIAFIRGNQLYTIQPNGSTLYQVTGATVMGYAWSPDHHEFVVRFSGYVPLPDFSNTVTQSRSSFPSVLGVVSVDGGNIMAITPGGTLLSRSDAWWDADGNRLFYAEGHGNWILSQADQPSGIARKEIAASGSAPTSAPDGSQVAMISNAGEIMIGTAGQPLRVLHSNVLHTLANGMPAMPLWQPHHQAIAYPIAGTQANQTLMLTNLQGKTAPLYTGTGIDAYAWSPDGNSMLVHDTAGWAIVSAKQSHTVMRLALAAKDSVPFWSPDSAHIAFRSNDTGSSAEIQQGALYLVTVKTATVTQIATVPQLPARSTIPVVHPVTGSPWSSDSKQLVLVSAGGTWFNGHALATKTQSGTGLYSIDITHIDQTPSLADWGEHLAVSWSTPDPNTQIELP